MSFTTVYRAVVMIAAGVIAVKGWQLYGPANDDIKALATRALSMAQAAINKAGSASATGSPGAADPRIASPGASLEAPAANSTVPPPLLSSSGITVGDGAARMTSPDSRAAATDTSVPSATLQPNPSPATDEQPNRMAALMERLKQLGADETNLSPWGGGGAMYRFQCRASLGGTASFARHFEAVASEPTAAVEQVLANVEAWRMRQREHQELD